MHLGAVALAAVCARATGARQDRDEDQGARLLPASADCLRRERRGRRLSIFDPIVDVRSLGHDCMP
jgi:hypothetical protein